jgi:ATP-binding cassette subfamily B protein
MAGGEPTMVATRVAVRRIAVRFRTHRWRLLASMMLVVISVGLSMTWPLLLKEVINTALPQHRTGLLTSLCLAMITVGVLSSVIMVGQGAVANSLGQAVVHGLRADVYARVQSMPLEFFSGEPNTDIQALLSSDIGGISDIISFTGQGALAAVVNLLAAGLVMLILSWPLALVSLLLAVALNLANSRFTHKRRKLAALRQEKVADMLKAVGEDLAMPGVILGRTLGRSAAQREKFLGISQQIAGLTRKQRLAGSGGRALIGMTLACLPPAVYWMSGTLVPGLSLGAVVVLSTMQVRVSSPIQQLLALNGEFQASLAMFERVFAYLDLELQPTGPPAATLGQVLSSPDPGPVILRSRQVSFRYPGTDQDAISRIDLSVERGTTTLIAGKSGSGKSTLALILSGLMTPTSGVIELDGRPAAQPALQAKVTLLSQEGATFNASLRDNLLFAKPDATEAELRAAIGAARLGYLLARLSDGLDTILGERGYQLSGGERQRVALARVLLAPSPVLVADEPTSAVDVTTAEWLYRALRDHAQEGALVLITHRIPPLAAEDRILLLDNGRVAESGTHAELSSDGSAYANLLRQQAVGLDDDWAFGLEPGLARPSAGQVEEVPT